LRSQFGEGQNKRRLTVKMLVSKDEARKQKLDERKTKTSFDPPANATKSMVELAWRIGRAAKDYQWKRAGMAGRYELRRRYPSKYFRP
jgi:hypothetical protein